MGRGLDTTPYLPISDSYPVSSRVGIRPAANSVLAAFIHGGIVAANKPRSRAIWASAQAANSVKDTGASRGGRAFHPLTPAPFFVEVNKRMQQLSLNWQQQAIQPKELARCRAVIAPLILAFWRSREVGAQFHMVELTRYVASRTTIAPDSAGRILRDMRQAKELNYSVIDRRNSLYQIEPM